MSDWARVARIAKTRNLEGSLVLQAVDGLPFLLSPHMDVRFVPPTLRGPFGGAVDEVREFREGSFEVSFDTVHDVRTAEKLVGSYCLVRKADLPDIDRLEEPATLVGCQVVDDAWGDLGTVAGVDEGSLQARLVVHGGRRERSSSPWSTPSFPISTKTRARSSSISRRACSTWPGTTRAKRGSNVRIETLSTFPDMYASVMGASMMRIAQDKGALDFCAYDLRDWTHDRHRTTDDEPYGGGQGLVMKCAPIFEAYDDIAARYPERPHTIFLTPTGTPFTEASAQRLAREDRLLFICGHYEASTSAPTRLPTAAFRSATTSSRAASSRAW